MADFLDVLDTIGAGKAGPPSASFTTMVDPPSPGSDFASQLEAIAGGQKPAPIPGAAVPPGGFNQRAGSLATGFNDILAQTLGAPFDLGTGLGNLAGRGINALTGTQTVPPATNALGADYWRQVLGSTIGRTEPKDTVDRLLYGAGAGLGGAAQGAGVGLGLQALGRAPAVASALIGPLSPGGAAGNAALGAASGVGSAAGELAAGEDPAARAVGNVAGGLAVPLGIGGAIAGGRALSNLLGPALTRAGAERGAAQTLQSSVEDRLAALRNFNDSELVPGSRPSFAQATGDPGLVRQEGDVVARLGAPENWSPAQERLADLARQQGEARTAAVRGIADPNAQPAAVQDVLRQRLATLDAETEATATAARANVDQAMGQIGAPVPPEVRGGLLRDQMEAAKAADKAATRRLWEAIDPDGTLRIDQTPVRQAAQDIRQQTPAAARPPEGEEKAIFDIAGMGGTAVPFSETQALRSRLLTAIREERRANGETPALRRLSQLRQAVDNSISDTAERAAASDPQIAQRLQEPDAATSTAGRAVDDRASPAGNTGKIPGMGPPDVRPGVLRDEVAAGGRPADAAGMSQIPPEPRRPADLIEFLIKNGGVRDEGGELRARDLHRVNPGYFGRLSHEGKGAMSLDYAREAAIEAGYLHPDSDITDLLNALERNSKGQRVFNDSDRAAIDWQEFQRSRGHYEEQSRLDAIPFPGQQALDALQARDATAAERAANPPNFDAAAAERYRTAAAATRQGAEIFRNQFTGPMLTTRGAAGDYKVPDTGVGARILANNESAQAFLAAGGNEAALRGALTDDLHRTLRGRPVTEPLLQQWRNTREGALRAAPGFGEEVANVGRAQTRLDALTRAQTAERTAFQAGKVGQILGAAAEDVPGMIGKTFERQSAATDFMRLRRAVAGDPDAEAGLARAAADYVAGRFVNLKTDQLKPMEFLRFLNQKEGALRAAGIPQKGMQSLRAIAEDMQRPAPGTARTVGANRGGTPSAYSNVFRQVMSQTAKRPSAYGGFGTGALAGMALVGDVATTGGLAAAGLGAETLVRFLQAHGIQRVDQVLAEAAINPAFGRALLLRATPQNMPIAETAIRAALQGQAALAGTSYDYERAGQRRRPAR